MERPRLLLIDDEPALAEFVANAARECGYSAQVATDDLQFREEFLENRPNMVALDLGMPGMDGVELLRFLAEEGYRSPVLIISGFDRRVLEIGLPTRSGARPEHGRSARKAGAARRARSLAQRAAPNLGVMIATARSWPARRSRARADQPAAAHGLSAQGLAGRRQPGSGRGAGPLDRPRARPRPAVAFRPSGGAARPDRSADPMGAAHDAAPMAANGATRGSTPASPSTFRR